MSRVVLRLTINNMCGIVFCQSKTDRGVSRSVAKRYKQQSHRGKQGFAFLSIVDDYVSTLERRKTEGEILDVLKDVESNCILFHHRFPTSTVNIPSATHPIYVSNDSLEYDYYVVHNGVLQNEDELKKEHEKMGFKYTTVIENMSLYRGTDGVAHYSEKKETFNDSEALAIDLALYLEGKSEKMKSRGSIAFVCIQTTKKGKQLNLFFGRNEGNPLVVEDNKEMLCVRSEGHGWEAESDMLYSISFADGKFALMQEEMSVGIYYARVKPTVTKELVKSNWLGRGYPSMSDEERLNKVMEERERKELARASNVLDGWEKNEDGEWEHNPSSRRMGFSNESEDEEIRYEDIPEPTHNDLIANLYDTLVELEDKMGDVKVSIELRDENDVNTEDLDLLLINLTKEYQQVEESIQQAESLSPEERARTIFE